MAVYKKLDAPVPVYSSNPSIADVEPNLITKKVKKTINGNKSLIITDSRTGEQQTGYYGATFYEERTVDTEQFLKFYVSGINELLGLSPAALKVFRLIYLILVDKPNIDAVSLDCKALKIDKKWNWSQPTFNSGLNELLSKQIIFKSIYSTQYFINIKFFFNGDRVNVVKSYKLRKTDIFDEQNLLT